MTTDDADYIARNMKKGGLGLLLFIIGMANAASIGGYYIYGEKRKSTDVKPGEIRLFGVNISHLFLHHPAIFGPFMLGATMMRVVQQYAEYNRNHPPDMSKGSGGGAGLEAGAWGVAQGIPFIDTPLRLAESKKDGGKFWMQFAESLVTPPDVRRIAKAMDKAGEEQTPREQKTLGQVLQGSVPGQRGKLPLDVGKMKFMTIDRVAEIVQNAPEGTINRQNVHEVNKLFASKLKAAKDDLSLKEQLRYERIADRLSMKADMAPEKLTGKERTKAWRDKNYGPKKGFSILNEGAK